MTDTPDYSSIEYQNLIINYCLFNDSILSQVRPVLKDSFFDGRMRRNVRNILKYYDDYCKIPPFAIFDIEHIKQISLDNLSEDFALKEIIKFCKHKVYFNTIMLAADFQSDDKFDQADEVLAGLKDFGKIEDPWGVVYGNEIGQIEPPVYLMDPWLIKDTVTMFYGAPGSFKSFIILDTALQLATGTGSVAKTSVCYVAAEGASGINLRTEAWCEYHNKKLAKTDIMFFTKPFNLMSDAETSQFINKLKSLQTQHNIVFGLVVIDTLSQCIPGADENSQAFMTKAASNMTRIRRELNATIVAVHHTGKDETRGARGSNATIANTDAAIYVQRSGIENNASAYVIRQKDGPIGKKMYYNLIPHAISRLAGKELGGSLVCELSKEPISHMTGMALDLTKQKLLREIAKAMPMNKAMSVRSVCLVMNKADTNQSKQQIADVLPLDKEVLIEVQGNNYVLLRTSTSGFGEVIKK